MGAIDDAVFEPRQEAFNPLPAKSETRVIYRIMPMTIKDRIEQRLAEMNLSPRAASLKVSTNADLIRGVLRADAPNPTRDTIEKIARVLEVTPEWLLGSDTGAPRAPGGVREVTPADIDVPQSHLMRRDLPVYGTALGSLVDGVEGLAHFSTMPVEYVRRPPVLEGVRDAYAFYVSGDSMYPAHPHGALRIVHPHRPVSPGDTVIVTTKHWDSDPGQAYIKIFRRRTSGLLVLEQFNPAAELQVPTKFVESVHKVLDMNDLYGV